MAGKILLTKRQVEVFEMYKNGKTQEEIAILLYGSKYRQGDVSNILKFVKRKLGSFAVKKYHKGCTGFVEYPSDDLKQAHSDLEHKERGEI